MAHRTRLDGVEVVVQPPDQSEEERAYVHETRRESDAQMAAARERLVELLQPQTHRLADKKRTEIAVEIVQQLEQEGHFPQAAYACDHGVLTLE
jgi:DNA-directed RNA polymerase specialized sigma54-like protein